MNDTVILNGFHAIKHALRFDADIIDIVTVDPSKWQELARELAPDVTIELAKRARVVSPEEFRRFSPEEHPTGIAAIAKQPDYELSPAAQIERLSPAILLEDPRRLGNVGATIRVAAAAEASSVLTTGDVDPWHPASIRGSAGLHFALPVSKITSLKDLRGPVLAMDADGTDIGKVAIPRNAILAFGTERNGVSPELRDRADMIVSLPMRSGVSSLNLATSVAATLYYWRFKQVGPSAIVQL